MEQEIKGFLDEKGRIAIWPAKQAKKRMVTAYLAGKFSESHVYTEGEVNALIGEWHTFDDYFLLRRSLVEYGYLDRKRDGSAYWVRGRTRIQPFAPDQAGALCALIRRTIRQVNLRDYGPERTERYALSYTPEGLAVASAKRHILVAREEERILGTLGIERAWQGAGADYCFLTVFVEPGEQGKGIGRQLIQAGEAYVRGQGGASVLIPSSITGRGFYRRMGYLEIDGPEPDEEGIIPMRKQLKARPEEAPIE